MRRPAVNARVLRPVIPVNTWRQAAANGGARSANSTDTRCGWRDRLQPAIALMRWEGVVLLAALGFGPRYARGAGAGVECSPVVLGAEPEIWGRVPCTLRFGYRLEP
ncbi:MAG TPA: hypothetical protein VIV64_04770 [Gammaproteobacteria bacterium]|jgi:hypothetical protein